MEFSELKYTLRRLYKEHIRYHLNKILLCLFLSIVIAGTTSTIAWLLDPAVKKIFIDKNPVLTWMIPLAIIITFSVKGLSLYFARVNIIVVGQTIAGELQKKIAESILFSDIQTLDSRHSGRYVSNISYDSGQVSNLVSTGVLNLMKDSFSVILLVSLMFYQNWKLATFAIFMIPLAGGLAKNLGKIYHNITLQTFFDNTSSGGSRIRVRPLNSFQKNTRVEFPKSLRETNDIGSKFSASVKVCQKTFNTTGLPKGQPYLLADNKTITLLKK